MAAEGGPKKWRGASPVPSPNPDWLDDQAFALLARYYVGEYDEAWRRLQPLVDGAPALSFLRSAKSEIANARGWPRLADEEAHIAAELTQADRSTEIALVDAALSRKRYDEAAERTSALVSLFPGDQAVERLRQSVRAHDAPELRIESDSRTEHGDAADRPGSGYDVRSALLAPPIAERWRLKAAYEFSQASPVEGVIGRSRYGAGVETDWPDASLDATAWINRGTLDRPGGRVAGTWEIGDHLQVAGEGELYSGDTPMRATYYGISANDGAVRVTYAWDSQRLPPLAAAPWFTDGNDRLEASGFFTSPSSTAESDGRAAPGAVVGHKHATRCAVFQSPPDRLRDFGAAARHLLGRRYERSLHQELRARGGRVRTGGQPNSVDRFGQLRANLEADDRVIAVRRSRLRA